MQATTLWNRLSGLVLVLLLASGVLAVGLWYWPEIRRNEQLQAERLELERQLAETRAHGAALRGQLRALTDHPAAMERLIRERLGLARPGEWVVHFEPPLREEPATGRR